MLGGFNAFGNGAYAERIINNLPKHSKARIYINFWKIGKIL